MNPVGTKFRNWLRALWRDPTPPTHIELNMKSCAGGCGTEVEMSEQEAHVRTSLGYPLHWWCDSCYRNAVEAAQWEPLLNALDRNPALAAKVRKALGVDQ